MSIVIFRHKVKDFATWKPIFDSTEAARKAAGEKSVQVIQVEGDPNDVILVCNYTSADGVKGLMATTEIQEAMQRSGVLGEPEVTFGTAA